MDYLHHADVVVLVDEDVLFVDASEHYVIDAEGGFLSWFSWHWWLVLVVIIIVPFGKITCEFDIYCVYSTKFLATRVRPLG